MKQLTLADRRILSMIEYAPRISFKEMASACHLSKDTIKYRINRLQKDNIIEGFSCFIDYTKLGYQSYKLYFKIRGSILQKKSILEYLQNLRNVFSIFESTGTWNLGIAVFAKTHEEFNRVENMILERYGDIIIERKYCAMIDAQLFQQDFFNNSMKFPQVAKLWGTIENYELDGRDKELIRLLHNNSRIQLTELAAKLRLSIDAIKNRIQRLKNKKIVTIYNTEINYEKLGYDQYKLLIYPGIYSDKTELDIINFLKNTSYCINIIRTIGPWKLEAEFLAKKYYDIEKILGELNERFKNNIFDYDIAVLRNEKLFAYKALLL